MRRCLLVTGMHRSGTSALSRTLNLLGARMGYGLQEPDTDNIKGFWEPSEVVAIHEQLFSDLQFRHDTHLGIAEAQLHSEAAIVASDRLLHFMRSAFSADDAVVVIKDPRICRLIPLWQQVLERAEFELNIVLPIRNPLEVALSLQVRNGYPINKGLLMWLRHILAAERGSRTCRRTIVTYDQLMADWRGVAAQIGHDLDIIWPRDIDEAAVEIDAFLDDGLRHHRVEAPGSQAELAWVASTWDAMRGLVDHPQEQPAVLDHVFEEFGRAEIAFAPLYNPNEDARACEIVELHAQIRSRDETLEQIRVVEQDLRGQLATAQLQAAGLVAINASQRKRQDEMLRDCRALSEQLLAQMAEVFRDAAALRKEWGDRGAQIEGLGARTDVLADEVKDLKRRLMTTDKCPVEAMLKRSRRRPVPS